MKTNLIPFPDLKPWGRSLEFSLYINLLSQYNEAVKPTRCAFHQTFISDPTCFSLTAIHRDLVALYEVSTIGAVYLKALRKKRFGNLVSVNEHCNLHDFPQLQLNF